MRNQRNKNIALLIITVFLLCCSVVLTFTGNNSSSTLENPQIFSVADTSSIDQILISRGNRDILLQRSISGWKVNEKLNVDKNMIRVLLAIVKDMEVVRPVSNSQTQEVVSYMEERGYRVMISVEDEMLKHFLVVGSENKTSTYMMELGNGPPMIVNIPGYDSYVAGIFEIPANNWRDRTILSTNWRTLKQLDIEYAEFPDYDVKISFRNNFLFVDGIDNLDTAAMMNYIDQFNDLQADRFIEKSENPIYDSLFATPSTVSISIQDIHPENSKSIIFYPIVDDDPMMLGYVKEDDQLVLFDTGRIQGLFAIKDDFKRMDE